MSSSRIYSYKVEAPSKEEIARVLRKPSDAVAFAATSSITVVSRDILSKGRQAITSSGGKFKGKWVSGLQARQYPKRKKPSSFAKVYINHKLGGVASVFERGARIKGRQKGNKLGLLWIPLPGTPKNVKISQIPVRSFITGKAKTSKRATPARVAEKRGGLEYAKPGRYPLLGYYVGTGKRRRFKALFYGISAVDVPRKIRLWGIVNIAKREADRLPSLFNQALKAADGK